METGQFICWYDGQWSVSVGVIQKVTAKRVVAKMSNLDHRFHIPLHEVYMTGTEEDCLKMKERITSIQAEKRDRTRRANDWASDELKKLRDQGEQVR